MDIRRDASSRLKSLARVLEKEYLAADQGHSWVEFLGKLAVIFFALGTLSLMILFGVLYVLARAGHRSSRHGHGDLLYSLTGPQFLLIWGITMAIILVLGYLSYRRHKDSGIMVDEWSETKGKNPFEPFAVMIFQTLDTFFVGKSPQETERAAMFAALVLKHAAEDGGMPLVTSCQISPDTQNALKKALKVLPPPLEQEEILKNLYKSGILRREDSQTSTSATAFPGEAGLKLVKRFELLDAR